MADTKVAAMLVTNELPESNKLIASIDIASDMVKNPGTYGMAWVSEPVNAERDKSRNLGDIPLLVLEDVTKFRLMVPNADAIIKGMADGTSFRVAQQDVGRRGREKNATIKSDELKVRCVQRILGIRTRGPAGPKEVHVPADSPKAVIDALVAQNLKVVLDYAAKA